MSLTDKDMEMKKMKHPYSFYEMKRSVVDKNCIMRKNRTVCVSGCEWVVPWRELHFIICVWVCVFRNFSSHSVR